MILMAGLAACALIYFLFILPTQWLKVERVRYPCGLGVRVLQISDLHAEMTRIGPRRLARAIRRERPDYIALTGDFTQVPGYLPRVRQYAQAVGACGVPAFAVLGNHDHHLSPADLGRLIGLLEDAGIRVLNNRSAPGKGFRFVGIDNFGSRRSNVKAAFAGVDREQPVLVLTHDPNLIPHLRRPYAYLMAGHFHGMQFHLPFLFRFLGKGELPAKGIYKGLHNGEYGPFYISKGVGQSGLNARFLIRSEITVHEL